MEKFLKNQQIPLTQVIDPNTGQAYYSTQNVVYQDKNNTGVTYLRDNTTIGEMSTVVPTITGGTQVVRVLGHCYWNNIGSSTQWMMKFRPSNDWILI